MSAAAGQAGLAAFQLWSAYQQAEMMEKQGELTQRLAESNAKYKEIDAWEAELFGYTQSAVYETEITQTVGAQRASMAAADVDVSFGTAAEIQNEAKLTGRLNVMDIQNQAFQKARGIRQDASNIRLGGEMARTQATMDATAVKYQGYLSAASAGANYAMKKG